VIDCRENSAETENALPLFSCRKPRGYGERPVNSRERSAKAENTQPLYVD